VEVDLNSALGRDNWSASCSGLHYTLSRRLNAPRGGAVVDVMKRKGSPLRYLRSVTSYFSGNIYLSY
jgi:hypothetical protein